MIISVTPDRLSDLLSQCNATLLQSHITLANLRSVLGMMSFITTCVRPARIFMNGLLNALQSNLHSCHCPISDELKSDLQWWCSFLPRYNDPLLLSTDACQKGAGALFNGYFFHTPFPDNLLETFGHDIDALDLLTILIIKIIFSYLYSAFSIQNNQMRLTTLCGGLCQTACLFRRKLQPRSSQFIRKHSMIHWCPQIRISDKPSHQGHCPLLFPNSVWVL